MKRCGFTLAELIISIGIIGLVGALTAPLVGKIMPDKNKAMFLKAYDTTQEIVNRMANDTSLFAQKYNYNGVKLNISDYPLVDDKANKNTTDFKSASGKTKFCNLFAEFLDVSSPKCSDTTYTYAASTFNNKFTSNAFETKNGMQWWIVAPTINKIKKNDTTYTITYQTDIYVDVNPTSNGKNCFFDKNNCKSPDRFKFMVDAAGNVVPADPAGNYYKTHRSNMGRGDMVKQVNNSVIVKNLADSVRKVDVPVIPDSN